MASSFAEDADSVGLGDNMALMAGSPGRATTPPSSNSTSQTHSQERVPNASAGNDMLLGSRSTAGQFAFAPATQQTTVVTTTTTTVTLAPFVLQPPELPYDRDPKQYPLATSRTPAHLRSIRFEIGGRLASFTENDDAEGFLGGYKQEQRALQRAGGNLIEHQEDVSHAGSAKRAGKEPQSEHHRGLRSRTPISRPEAPPSLAAAAELAEGHRRKGKRATHTANLADNGHTEMTPDERRSSSKAVDFDDPLSDFDVTPSNAARTTRLSRSQALMRKSPGLQLAATTRSGSRTRRVAPDHRSSGQYDGDQLRPSSGTLAAATPPIMDSDVEVDAPPVNVQAPRPTLPSVLNTTNQDASLPSPSLSPVTAAANMAQRQFLHTRQIDNEDVSDLSGLDALPPPRKRKTPPLFDASNALALIGHESAVEEHRSRSPKTLMDVPDMISMFDSLPEQLQSYVMFQLLKRSSKRTLNTVADVVNPALKCDPFGILPVEICLKITKFLDGRSLCRAASVSKRWRHLINSDETAWRDLLEREGYELPEGEIARAVREGWGWQFTSPDGYEENLSLRRTSRSSSKLEGDGQLVVRDNLSEDESSSVQRSTRKRKAGALSGSSKRQKHKAGPAREDEMRWMRDLQKIQGPIAYASAAARAVPDPKIGLPSLKSLHLFKSIYRRHRLIRETWMNERCQPRHLAFRAHHRHVVTCLLFDSERIITGSDDTSINVFDTKTGVLRKRLEGHEGGVWALSCDGNTLVSGSTDRSVRVWDITTGQCMQTFQGHTSTVRCLVILKPVETGKDDDGNPIMHPNEPIIITGSRDSTLRVWRLPTLDASGPHQAGSSDHDTDNVYALRTLNGHHNSVRAIAAYADTLVSGSYDFSVRVWRISSGEMVHRLTGHNAKVYSVVLDHERGRCISGSMDNLVKVWSLETGMCLFNLEGHTSLVGLLELSHGHLVSAAADSTLRVWDPENGACRSALRAHTGAITCFQHDGQKVISGSDRTLKMWNIETGECTRDLLTDLTGVWQVRFDERRCVAAVQRNNLTYIEVLDFGASRDGVPAKDRGRRIVVDSRGREILDDDSTGVVQAQA